MASDWPKFGFDLMNSGYQTTTDGLTVAALATFDIVSGYGPTGACLTGSFVRGQIAVVGNYLYAPSDDGKLYKILTSGPTSTWTFNGGGIMRATPHVTGGKVYICSSGGNLYRVDDTTGAADWTQALGCSYSSPLCDGTNVYVGSTDGKIYARLATDGTAVWAYDTGTSATGGCVTAVALYNGMVFAAAGDKVWAIDHTTGALTRWFPCRTGATCSSSPCLWTDIAGITHVVFGSTDHYYYSYNADTGHKIWERRTSGDVNAQGVAFTANTEVDPIVFLGQHNWRNGANFAATGKQHWVRDGTLSAGILVAPAVTGTGADAVEVTVFPRSTSGKQGDGRVAAWKAIDIAGGHTPQWKYGTSTGNNGGPALANKFNYGSPSIANGRIYCGADDFGIYAFET